MSKFRGFIFFPSTKFRTQSYNGVKFVHINIVYKILKTTDSWNKNKGTPMAR